MDELYWAMSIAHYHITHKAHPIRLLNWKRVLKSRFQFKTQYFSS